MGLELIEGDFDLPATPVRSGQLDRAGFVGIQDGGEQAVGAGVFASVIDRVVDDPNPDRIGAASLGAVGLLQICQPRPIRQIFDMPRCGRSAIGPGRACQVCCVSRTGVRFTGIG